ncbi:hypothetical protein [Neisseria zoodegmatis]|nr:hypothetical protein [Neisseria zoodegmatis]
MNRLLSSVPVWVILADMIYTFVLSILQSFNLTQSKLPKDGLPVAPDIAFSGLQVVANGGMILIIGFGLYVLLQLNRAVLQKRVFPIGVFRALGLIAVLAFSLPALWEWMWALVRLAGGHNTFNLDSPRYLIVAVCQPLVALLCVWCLYGWQRLRSHVAANVE